MVKYKPIIYKALDMFRGSFSVNECKEILASLLFVKWLCDNDNFIKDKSYNVNHLLFSNSFSEDLRELVKHLEKNYSKLDGILSTLLLKKIDYKDNLNETIKNVFELINALEKLSMNEIRDMINFLLIELDLNKDQEITPDSIKELMVDIIKPIEEMKIADYFTGVGSIILKIDQKYKNYNPFYYGEEINLETFLMARMLMIVNNIDNYKFINKDIYDFKNASKEAFDYVVMDAPFALSKELEKNEILKYGIPSKYGVDWANFQLALHVLKDDGKAIVTTTTGALFRTRDYNIRKAIVEEDKIEAVILLPSSLYKNTSIPSALIVFNKKKSDKRKNTIIFIDASSEYVRKNRQQNTITKDSIEKIITCYKKGNEIEGFCTISDINNVRDNGYNLNSKVYINAKVLEKRLSKTIYLKDVAQVLPGVQVSNNDMKSLKVNPTHYFLNIKNIQEDGIVYDEEEKIRDKNVNWYGKYDIKAGDIIMTTKGTTTRLVIVPDDFKKSFISSNLTIIRVNKQKYDPYVLVKYLQSDIGRLVLEKITTGATIKVINASKLENIEIPAYDYELIKKLGNRIKENELKFKERIKEAKEIYDLENEEIMRLLKLN
ncbi:MAG: N-6 DNA methylase [Mollicutes bacterium]|nr:N-6 DNA methylase [Mollicutes bacterium]